MQVGSRWRSAECTTEVVVVRAASVEASLECGGVTMIGHDDGGPSHCGDDAVPEVLLGKRYTAANLGIEVLCTKAGCGPLRLGGVQLALKEAKPLPASD